MCKHINKYYIFRTWFIIFTMFMQNSLYWIKVIVSLLINDYIVPDYPFSFWNILFTKIQVKNINSLQMILVCIVHPVKNGMKCFVHCFHIAFRLYFQEDTMPGSANNKWKFHPRQCASNRYCFQNLKRMLNCYLYVNLLIFLWTIST